MDTVAQYLDAKRTFERDKQRLESAAAELSALGHALHHSPDDVVGRIEAYPFLQETGVEAADYQLPTREELILYLYAWEVSRSQLRESWAALPDE